MTIIRAATPWNTNGDLIADLASIGYLRKQDKVLDPTAGKMVWWSRWKPDDLVTHDIAWDGVDFRKLPYDDETFDVVAFDPPYVSSGGRQTTTIPDMFERYGMTDAPRTPKECQGQINDGLSECNRVVKKRGLVLCKVQDYISSGRLFIGTHHTLTHALSLGMELRDRAEMLTSPRPQPPNRGPQRHLRRNLSTMLVLERRK